MPVSLVKKTSVACLRLQPHASNDKQEKKKRKLSNEFRSK